MAQLDVFADGVRAVKLVQHFTHPPIIHMLISPDRPRKTRQAPPLMALRPPRHHGDARRVLRHRRALQAPQCRVSRIGGLSRVAVSRIDGAGGCGGESQDEKAHRRDRCFCK